MPFIFVKACQGSPVELPLTRADRASYSLIAKPMFSHLDLRSYRKAIQNLAAVFKATMWDGQRMASKHLRELVHARVTLGSCDV